MTNPQNNDFLTGTDAVQTFVRQFGDMTILYNRIVLEELLKELLGIEEKDGEEKQ
jgi:hypothetical protein